MRAFGSLFGVSRVNSLHRVALRVAALAFLGLAAVAAQTPANDAESTRLDDAAASLKQIYATLQQPDLTPADLDKLQEQAKPVSGDIQTALEHLSPRLEALKTQLDQLGPAPGPKASPESTQVATERAQRQKAYDDVDALVKRANLLAVQADQANARIVQARRARLAQTLFAT